MNPDREMVAAVLANRAGAFERLVREYQGLVWHIVHRMVRHTEEARELCQETFLRVHRTLHQYRHDAALKSWIGRVAYSIALRHLEKRRLDIAETAGSDGDLDLLDQVDSGFDLEAASGDADLARHLRDAIETLPPLPRTLVTLYHLDELSLAEIGAITGLANGTIKSHLFRARLLLRQVLESRLGAIA